MDYSFFNNLTLVDTGRTRTPRELNPKGMSVRIFSNGDVYPSKELTKKYNLEFVNRESTEVANGIDVIDSIEWTPMNAAPRVILFGFTPKSEAKVDLFGSCKFNDDGSPKASVLTQGSSSETLLNLVRSMGYLTEEQKYVDLVVLEQYPITMQDGIANIPKVIERGPKKGERTYERREDVIFYPVTTTEEFEKIPTATAQPVVENVVNTTQVETN